jgi:diadenosine tetraphosphate (Ap4A) HIT family hydrolase
VTPPAPAGPGGPDPAPGPPGCDACAGRWPDPVDRIADLGQSVAYLHADQFFPGWTVLVLKRHAAELYELPPADRAALMDEVSAVAEALAHVFRPVKVNYALLGNVLPHVHWHVIPRLSADPAPRDAVWAVPHAPVALVPAERRGRLAALRAALGR